MSPDMQNIISIIEAGANSAMTLEQIIMTELDEWLVSKARRAMIDGQRYYRGEADVMQRYRTIIGDDGKLERAENLANHRLIHPFLRKMTDQKVGYLLAKPMSIQTNRTDYAEVLGQLFDKAFMRILMNVGKEAISKGKAWLHVYYDERGNLLFKRIPAEEIIPIWHDAAHTTLDAVIRVYDVEAYEGIEKKIITKVEFWDNNGVRKYVKSDKSLILDPDTTDFTSHMLFTDSTGNQIPMNWERIPFICFKYNDEELPLITFVKSLMDDYDDQMSLHADNLEDLPNSIYVVRNYDGQDLGQFRKNISTYRAVKVFDNGDVNTIDLKIDTEAYTKHMEMLRKDIYEFGRGVDTQSEKFGNSPSGIALRFLYSDLDMDANILETEFQAALEQLRWFIDRHLINTTGRDFTGEAVDFIFNRDILMNETDTINNVKSSMGILSEETVLANHPWVTDVQEELDRLAQQKQAGIEPLNIAQTTEPAATNGTGA